MKYMSIGDKVLVSIPANEQRVHTPIAKYHGQEMQIANRVTRSNGLKVYYELVGAESQYGIPYGFVKEWLIQL